jgi:hypothetical protein
MHISLFVRLYVPRLPYAHRATGVMQVATAQSVPVSYLELSMSAFFVQPSPVQAIHKNRQHAAIAASCWKCARGSLLVELGGEVTPINKAESFNAQRMPTNLLEAPQSFKTDSIASRTNHGRSDCTHWSRDRAYSIRGA